MKNHLKYFSETITYEDVENHKPFPDAYNLAIKKSKMHHSNCLAIEDSKAGVMAANAAKINCLLTLPPWQKSGDNFYTEALACVDSLGSKSMPTKVLYGQELINCYVDYEYILNIIQ